MNIQFNKLCNYIREYLNRGIPEDYIKQTLLHNNWNIDLINKAFLHVKTPLAENYQQTNLGHRNPITTVAKQKQQNFPIHENYNKSTAPEKYKVFRSISDILKTIKNSGTNILLVTIISYVITIALFLLILLIVIILLSLVPDSRTFNYILGFIILSILYVFANLFVLASTSLAIYYSSENIKVSVKTIVLKSFSGLKRIIIANILVVVTSIWPIVLAMGLPILFTLNGFDGVFGRLVGILSYLLIIGGVYWMYASLFNFALAPYIALLEPEIPILKVLKRSKHLLIKGGRWFLIKSLLFSSLTGYLLLTISETSKALGIIIGILFIIITPIMLNGMLVMLYRNRKMIRGNL